MTLTGGRGLMTAALGLGKIVVIFFPYIFSFHHCSHLCVSFWPSMPMMPSYFFLLCLSWLSSNLYCLPKWLLSEMAFVKTHHYISCPFFFFFLMSLIKSRVLWSETIHPSIHPSNLWYLAFAGGRRGQRPVHVRLAETMMLTLPCLQ